ncbi:MAG TPA: hypothetical protein VGI81_07265 [Tepidisphaeraceae bacterium]
MLRDRERRAEFIERFNEPGAVDVDGQTALTLVRMAHEVVRAELTRPDTAEFVETFVRHCVDGATRSAGQVWFEGADGNRSEAGYLVEFDPAMRAKLLDLCDGDPVTLKHLPPPATWDGTTIPYRNPSTGAPTKRDLFWPVFWVVIVGLIATAVVLALWR